MRLNDYPHLAPGETAWEWDPGIVVIQKRCGWCDKGLLKAPVRFCGYCDGTGYQLVRRERDRREVLGLLPPA